MMDMIIRPMLPTDNDRAIALWQGAGGLGLSATDTRENFDRYLARNPCLSLVAVAGTEMVGAVLGGHDGRRGYIHHLAVDPGRRRRGIGRALIDKCRAGLAAQGIDKCHLFVFAANPAAQAFWKSIGWELRGDLVMMSKRV